MMSIDFHELPKLRDSLTYCYIEHALIDRKDSAIEYIQKDGWARDGPDCCVMHFNARSRNQYYPCRH